MGDKDGIREMLELTREWRRGVISTLDAHSNCQKDVDERIHKLETALAVLQERANVNKNTSEGLKNNFWKVVGYGVAFALGLLSWLIREKLSGS